MTTQKHIIPSSLQQKWFNLGVILSVSFTFPMIFVGHQLAQKYGPGTAICSILVGNLILWLIGMTVISMSMETRANALGNVRRYLGKYGVVFMWAVLMISFLNWFVYQIHAVVLSIGAHWGEERPLALVGIGVGLGLFITLLSIGGIRFIKWATIITAPFIIGYYLFSVSRSEYSVSFSQGFGLSFSGIISTVLILLSGIVNLPTFFRYSRSRADSYLGLAIMVLLISLFQISSIWMGFSEHGEGTIVYGVAKDPFFSMATLGFILLTLIYINLINIYYASVCWEAYVPWLEGAKGYVVIGLMGTACYAGIRSYTPVLFLGELTNTYLANLGVVLLIAYLAQITIRQKPHRFEKILNGFCWFAGCFISTVIAVQDIQEVVHPLLAGILTSTSIFLFVMLIEEVIWSIRKIQNI